MIVSHDREKLINAIIFFLNNAKHCHTLKLFKLLNFADFEHFRQTGRTITGLNYKALPMGPVPTDLLNELERGGDSDLREAVALFQIKDHITDELLRRDLKPKSKFDPKYFSRRELDVMKRIADFFFELRAVDMSEFSHMKKLPWRTVFGKGEGRGLAIPADLALTAEPMMHDEPSIDPEEVAYRRELLKGLA